MKNNFFSKLTLIVVLFCIFNGVQSKRTQQSLEPKSAFDEKLAVLKDIMQSHSRLDVKLKALIGLEKLEDVDNFDFNNGEVDFGASHLNAESFDDDAPPTSWKDDSDLALVEFDPNSDDDDSHLDDDNDHDYYGFLAQNDANTGATETDFDILDDIDTQDSYSDDTDDDDYDVTDDVSGAAAPETDFDILYDVDSQYSSAYSYQDDSDDEDYDLTDDVSVDYFQTGQAHASLNHDDSDVVLLDDEEGDNVDEDYDGYDPLVLNDAHVHHHDHHDHHHDHHDDDNTDDFEEPEPLSPVRNDDEITWDHPEYQDLDDNHNKHILQL